MTTEDERSAALDERIRALPAPPLPPALASRVHSLARAALQDGDGAGRGARRAAGFATAAAVVSAIALYLSWAVRFLSALAHG